MKCSEFITHLADRGVRCVLRGDRMVARGAATLPAWTRHALAAHREAITQCLRDGVDQELKPTATRHELKRLGFLQLDNGRFSHVRGDAVGDQILLGLIDPSSENQRATKEAIALGATPIRPTPQPVESLREIHPGRHRWAERPGHIYQDPFPRVERDREY